MIFYQQCRLFCSYKLKKRYKIIPFFFLKKIVQLMSRFLTWWNNIYQYEQWCGFLNWNSKNTVSILMICMWYLTDVYINRAYKLKPRPLGRYRCSSYIMVIQQFLPLCFEEREWRVRSVLICLVEGFGWWGGLKTDFNLTATILVLTSLRCQAKDASELSHSQSLSYVLPIRVSFIVKTTKSTVKRILSR